MDVQHSRLVHFAPALVGTQDSCMVLRCLRRNSCLAHHAHAHARNASGALREESDILDTWFSSALWPFSTLGWPEDTKDLRAFYPTDVLITGPDIIFFWVARMIMMGLKFAGDIPFQPGAYQRNRAGCQAARK